MSNADTSLAERLFLIQMERLTDPSSADVARVAAAAVTSAAIFRQQVGPYEDDAPAVPAPPLEARRTVGAVVRDARGSDGIEYIVVRAGLSPHVCEQARLDDPDRPVTAAWADTFVRWATREECKRHGILFADRTPPPTAGALTEAATALNFLLPRIGSWSNATWMQHLRHEYGDARADKMIAQIRDLGGPK